MVSFIVVFLAILVITTSASLLTVVTEKATPFVTLDAKDAEVMSGVKSYYWKVKIENTQDTQSMVHIEGEDTSSVRVRTEALIPGDYELVLSRCDFLRLDHTIYTIRVLPAVEERSTQPKYGTEKEREVVRKLLDNLDYYNSQCMHIMAPFFMLSSRLIHVIGDIYDGFMIYYQYYRDGTVSSEEFLSTTYRAQWLVYGLNTTHYDSIKTPEDLEAFRMVHHSRSNAVPHRFFLYSKEYFSWNRQNSNAVIVIDILTFVYTAQLMMLMALNGIVNIFLP